MVRVTAGSEQSDVARFARDSFVEQEQGFLTMCCWAVSVMYSRRLEIVKVALPITALGGSGGGEGKWTELSAFRVQRYD